MPRSFNFKVKLRELLFLVEMQRVAFSPLPVIDSSIGVYFRVCALACVRSCVRARVRVLLFLVTIAPNHRNLEDSILAFARQL